MHGFVGPQTVDVEVERRSDGAWIVNGVAAPGLEGCVHLDYGFTPATNFPHFRQLALADGQAADLPAAWLNVPPRGLELLRQRYERRGDFAYWYEAPDVGYSALLELTPAGLIRRYPELWELEA